jgi:formamidopyrimidine-DNA glycosylase
VPELPEVETVCRGLAPVMVGETLVRVEQRRPDLRFPFPEGFVGRLEGRVVDRIVRRAKFVQVHLNDGQVLIMHLGMSGRFTIDTGDAETAPGRFVHDVGGIAAHDHVVFRMSSGACVTYNDPRRFGYMDLVPAGADLEANKHFAGLGVEPLGNAFNAEHLAWRARGKTQDLKAFLLDQRNVAGLGNIYVCEALFRSRLSPRRRAGTLARKSGRASPRAELLVREIKATLQDAIAAGGSSLRDYAHADGSLGYFQHTFRAYDREGGACSREGCGGTIKRIVQSARSTFYCGRCQR